jgi:hypothetical protein
VSLFHEANGEPYMCPGRSLGRRYYYIRYHGGKGTYLSAYCLNGVRCDMMDQDTRTSVKAAGLALKYPTEYGIDIERLDTHTS